VSRRACGVHGRQASRLSWQTGFQPVVLIFDSRGRLCALTGQEACLPIREFLTDSDSATANPLVWGVR